MKKYKTVIRKSDCGCVLMRGGCTLYDMGGSYYRALTGKLWWFIIGSHMGDDYVWAVVIPGGSTVFILSQRKYMKQHQNFEDSFWIQYPSSVLEP